MYDLIFTKSFSRTERKRFRSCAIFLCFIIALGISSTLKLHLPPLSLIGDALKMHLSNGFNAGENMFMVEGGTIGNINPIGVDNPSEYLQLPSDAAENKIIINSTTTYLNDAIKIKKVHAVCRNSNYCDIEGDIRIEANSSTIFVITTANRSTKSWSIEPYPRKGTSRVKTWTITFLQHTQSIPRCTKHHSHPAILFSVGGFTGNFFHDFADVLFPLYSTASQFEERVQFLATDHKPWWISKFRQILNKLTKQNILDIDRETTQVHCYNNIQIGLKFHKELIINPLQSNDSLSTPSMSRFRLLLRQAYSLDRERVIKAKKGDGARPRLMIMSRKHTRILTNERDISRLATKMGYEVVVAEAGVSSNLSRFAEAVNSCDVLMGVHGAGLTNMVFLPDNAILIQVVPFGGVDGFARLDFGNPAAGMNIRYLDYKIRIKESSLSQIYSIDHPILRDPGSYMKWDDVWSIYLNKQNVTLDLHRFKGILAKALKLLRR